MIQMRIIPKSNGVFRVLAVQGPKVHWWNFLWRSDHYFYFHFFILLFSIRSC